MTSTEFLMNTSRLEPDWAKAQDGHLLLTHGQLVAEAQRRFGPDPRDWAFQCPGCGDVATPEDFLELGGDVDLAGLQCIGVQVREIVSRTDEDLTSLRGCETRAGFPTVGPWLVVVPGVPGISDVRKVSMFPLAEIETIPDCDMCDDFGCAQCDPEHHDWHALKWIAEGLTTLDEVVTAAEGQARYLRDRLEAGWVLDQPVDTGYIRMNLPYVQDTEVGFLMTTPGFPLNIPSLEFFGPDCPLCDVELSSEDGLWCCQDCGLVWSQDGQFLERLDDRVPQCFADSNHVGSSLCVRSLGHKGLHIGITPDGITPDGGTRYWSTPIWK